jgi:hypothetical protein
MKWALAFDFGVTLSFPRDVFLKEIASAPVSSFTRSAGSLQFSLARGRIRHDIAQFWDAMEWVAARSGVLRSRSSANRDTRAEQSGKTRADVGRENGAPRAQKADNLLQTSRSGNAQVQSATNPKTSVMYWANLLRSNDEQLF